MSLDVEFETGALCVQIMGNVLLHGVLITLPFNPTEEQNVLVRFGSFEIQNN